MNVFFSKWLKELNLFLKMTQNFLFFGFDSELIFWLWFLEWYCFVYYDPNKLNLFSNTTQRIELFLLIDMTQRIVFSHMSHRIEHFFEHERIEPSSFSWHKELNLFEDYLTPRFRTFVNREMELFEFGSRNWGLFNNITQKWLTLFGHDSQSWTFFSTWLKEFNPFKKTWFIEIEPFFTTWLENESFFLVWLQEFFFYKMYDSIKLIVFGKYDSKNWKFC